MPEKSYWYVKRDGMWAFITCPHCSEWYQVLNIPNEVETYQHCPWCGKSLFVRKEDKMRGFGGSNDSGVKEGFN